MFNGVLFQQSLQDLVKGIRAHRRDEATYIRERLTEIAAECRSSDMQKKSTAVLKLTYLQMMGFNVSFSNFHVVEVMSSSEFSNKRIGYLAAAQSFSPTTDVLLLTTNQFKKDLTSGRVQDCSQALTCLAKLVTESLACDLQHDVSLLLSSPRPYIRKKTLLVLYRLIMVHPDTLPTAASKFLDCLNDPDQGVVCAAVTVTCELARASPKNFLGLAPVLYDLLTTSTNNWMLIKIVKLMGVLTPLEPRLGKKLLAPIAKIMRTTKAKSLLYECCNTVTQGLMDFPEAVELCGERLGEFMLDKDQNLKYLGLYSMRKLAKAHPHIAMQHRDLILDCLDDVDIGIRMRALELVSQFVTQRTVQDISLILLRKLRFASVVTPAFQAAPDSLASESCSNHVGTESEDYAPRLLLDPETPYRDSLANQLLIAGEFVPGEGYSLLSAAEDFTWYVATVLGGLARIPGLSGRVSQAVASQLVEIVSRVDVVRKPSLVVAVALLDTSSNEIQSERNMPKSVAKPDINGTTNGFCSPEHDVSARSLIDLSSVDEIPPSMPSGEDTSLSAQISTDSESCRLVCAIVQAVVWIVGEYADLLDDPRRAIHVLLGYPTRYLDSRAHVSLITALMKVYSVCNQSSRQSLLEPLLNRLNASVQSEMAEVHERGWLLKSIAEQVGAQATYELRDLFDGKLMPVDPELQERVPVPEGLDLEHSLLDEGGGDLKTFLSQNDPLPNALLARNVSHMDTQEDDLFKQLAEDNAFCLRSRAEWSGKSPKYAEPNEKSGNPFYLKDSPRTSFSGSTTTQPVDQDAGVLLDLESNVADTSVAKTSDPVSVYTGDVLPTNVRRKAEDERELFGSKKHVEASSSRFEAAFDGIFSSSRHRVDDRPSKQKRRRRKQDRMGKSDADAGKNLIDLEDASSPPGATLSPSLSEIHTASTVPRHIGQEDELLR